MALACLLLKAMEVWPLILPVHTDVHEPKIGLNFSMLRAETLLTAACPLLSDQWPLHIL